MRDRLIQFLKNEGVTRKHVAKQINVSCAMLTLYLQNQRNLSEEKEQKLKEYLGTRTV